MLAQRRASRNQGQLRPGDGGQGPSRGPLDTRKERSGPCPAGQCRSAPGRASGGLLDGIPGLGGRWPTRAWVARGGRAVLSCACRHGSALPRAVTVVVTGPWGSSSSPPRPGVPGGSKARVCRARTRAVIRAGPAECPGRAFGSGATRRPPPRAPGSLPRHRAPPWTGPSGGARCRGLVGSAVDSKGLEKNRSRRRSFGTGLTSPDPSVEK